MRKTFMLITSFVPKIVFGLIGKKALNPLRLLLPLTQIPSEVGSAPILFPIAISGRFGSFWSSYLGHSFPQELAPFLMCAHFRGLFRCLLGV